jgi:DNA mismatch repair protein MSH4
MVGSCSSKRTCYYNSNLIGLELARLADLPSDVIEEGRRVANALADLHARREEESQTTIMATRRRALLKVCLAPGILASKPTTGRLDHDVLKLRSQLTQALDYSTLPEEELVAYLARFQKDIIQVFHETS